MAKAVKLGKGKEFTFKQTTGGAAESKYPWDEWFNGSLLMLERSEGTSNDKGTIEVPVVKKDYEVSNDAMPAKLKTAARRRYKVCQISRLDADGHRLKDALIIQARDMTPEERQDEDIMRAEEKEAGKERRKKAETNGTAPQQAAPAAQPEAAPVA